MIAPYPRDFTVAERASLTVLGFCFIVAAVFLFGVLDECAGEELPALSPAASMFD